MEKTFNDSQKATEVALVTEKDFGDKVHALVEKMPVWIIQSPINDPAVEEAWKRFRGGWLTRCDAYATFEDDVDMGTQNIIDHFAGHKSVHVYAAGQPVPDEAFVRYLRFERCEATDFGFILYRSADWQPYGFTSES